jgi:uncharacterized protein (TIGR00369 family)
MTTPPRSRLSWTDEPPAPPHVWRTLGYRGVEQGGGHSVIEWDATPDYCFHSPTGPIVHGGMVTTLLDTAMGGACWSLMDADEDFLTADLRTEFLRAARPGTLRAEGRVVQRNRRVVFCAAELFDAAGELLATSRCTQIVRRAG